MANSWDEYLAQQEGSPKAVPQEPLQKQKKKKALFL